MDLSKYFLSAPSDLHILGREKEIQLLKVYAFNAYFNADPLYTDNVNNGLHIERMLMVVLMAFLLTRH